MIRHTLISLCSIKATLAVVINQWGELRFCRVGFTQRRCKVVTRGVKTPPYLAKRNTSA